MDKVIRLLAFIVGATWAMAQTQVSLSADTLSVKMAEQINVKITVITENNPQIQFPPLQGFRPFEVIDTTAVDTLFLNKIKTFTKTYEVIHFDTGQITLPAQKVVVDGSLFSTDSLQIQVNDVEVDTLQQPLFPIKTILPIAKNTTGWWKPYAYGFIICLLLALGYFLAFQTQQRIRANRRKLPPF